jgi:hypothetical protein
MDTFTMLLQQVAPLREVKSVEIARCLLEHKPDIHCMSAHGNPPSSYGETPLHTINDMAILELLIEQNADVNAVIAGSGNTRLHKRFSMILRYDPDVIHFLVKNDANAYVVNK